MVNVNFLSLWVRPSYIVRFCPPIFRGSVVGLTSILNRVHPVDHELWRWPPKVTELHGVSQSKCGDDGRRAAAVRCWWRWRAAAAGAAARARWVSGRWERWGRRWERPARTRTGWTWWRPAAATWSYDGTERRWRDCPSGHAGSSQAARRRRRLAHPTSASYHRPHSSRQWYNAQLLGKVPSRAELSPWTSCILTNMHIHNTARCRVIPHKHKPSPDFKVVTCRVNTVAAIVYYGTVGLLLPRAVPIVGINK